jgi:hypothetical protein
MAISESIEGKRRTRVKIGWYIAPVVCISLAGCGVKQSSSGPSSPNPPTKLSATSYVDCFAATNHRPGNRASC